MRSPRRAHSVFSLLLPLFLLRSDGAAAGADADRRRCTPPPTNRRPPRAPPSPPLSPPRVTRAGTPEIADKLCIFPDSGRRPPRSFRSTPTFPGFPDPSFVFLVSRRSRRTSSLSSPRSGSPSPCSPSTDMDLLAAGGPSDHLVRGAAHLARLNALQRIRVAPCPRACSPARARARHSRAWLPTCDVTC